MYNSSPRQAPARGLMTLLGPSVLAGTVLALCLGMTLLLWRDAQRDVTHDLQVDFDFRARELMNNLALRMSTYTQVLGGVQGLFASSSDVTRQEFADYLRAQELEANFPGLQAVSYLQIVAPGQRLAHVGAVRREGFPAYSIVPEGARALYVPVLYLEPFSDINRRAFGFDAFADPVRRAMLERARDSGRAAMSGQVSLLQDGAAGKASGFLIALPLYQNGMAHETLEQRRAAIRGWICASFRARELMAGLGGARAAALEVDYYDGDSVDSTSRMAGGGSEPRALALPMHTQQRISIAGHSWTVAIGALRSRGAGLAIDRPDTILATGLAASAILALLTWLLARSRAQARSALWHARSLTGELESGQKRLAALADAAHRSQAMLRSILDSTIDAILVDNGDRRVLASNQRFRELWSVPASLELGGDDRALLEHMLDQLMHPAPFLHSRSMPLSEQGEQRELLRLKDGRFFEQYTRSVQLGTELARLWSFHDITERKQIEQRERSHRHVLELLGRGAPLNDILDAVVLGVESSHPDMLCSVHLLDADGRQLLTCSAPSMPDFYNAAVKVLQVAHGVASCGTAAASGARVIVEDIASHPFWCDFRELAARAQLAACWAEPIRGGSGKVLGTFSIYHRAPNYPSAANVVLIEQAAQLSGIAVEQAQAALALRAGEERFRSLYDHAPVALWEQDWSAVLAACAQLCQDGVTELGAYLGERPHEVMRLAGLVRILDLNDAALAQVGASGKDLGTLSLAQNFGRPALPAFIDAVVALAGGSQFFGCESSFLRLDGVARQNEVTLLVMPGYAHSLEFLIVSTVDITERKRMDAELLLLATTDFLTGLPNRREFMARLEDELARIQRNVDGHAAVLMLDIDHFKSVNDAYGHAMGDAVLRHLAGLMQACQRKIDTLGRMGGEEFAVLLPGAGPDAAAAYAERLRLGVAQTPLFSGGQSITVTVSIGISSIYPGDTSADAALSRADRALYSAKKEGRNRVGRLLDINAA